MRKILLFMAFLLTSAIALPQRQGSALPEVAQEAEVDRDQNAAVAEAFMRPVLEAIAKAEEVESSASPVEPSAMWEFVGLLFSAGLTTALLQLFRRLKLLSLIPAFFRPVLAGVVGIGTAALSAYMLTKYGVEIDLSAIVAFFGAGGGATALFAIGKEFNFLNSRG